jgi:hypothetical protein
MIEFKNQLKNSLVLNKMDSSMFAGMGDMFKNPEMMKSMEEMMKNPDIMSNAMKMMSDPSMQNMFGGMGAEAPDSDAVEGEHIQAEEVELESDDNIYDDLDFIVNEEVFISGLKTDTYNNKLGVIRNYNPDTIRYVVFIEEMAKTISVKPENITKKETEIVCEPAAEETIEVD